MAFQKLINITQVPAVEGDFASANPRHAVLSNEGGFKAGAAGVLIGRFAWADVATNTLLLNSGTGAPTGFIHRAMNGLNTTYFAVAGSATSFLIPSGFPVGEIFNGGDFWARNIGSTVAIGMKVFACNVAGVNAGAIQFAATGTVIASYVETRWIAATAGAAQDLIKISNTPLG
jgi:hypothetical protein